MDALSAMGKVPSTDTNQWTEILWRFKYAASSAKFHDNVGLAPDSVDRQNRGIDDMAYT